MVSRMSYLLPRLAGRQMGKGALILHDGRDARGDVTLQYSRDICQLQDLKGKTSGYGIITSPTERAQTYQLLEEIPIVRTIQ